MILSFSSHFQNCSTAVSLSFSVKPCLKGVDWLKGIPLSGLQHLSLAQLPPGYMVESAVFMLSILTSFRTVTPGQAGQVHEGVEKVEERPGDHDDVVTVLQEHHGHGRVSNTL